jgi:hypothetical protein
LLSESERSPEQGEEIQDEFFHLAAKYSSAS